MATSKDLIGIWRGDAMFVPNSQIYEVLVFRMDGTGFLDFYLSGRGRAHYFRWSVAPPDGLEFTGYQPPREVVRPEHAPEPVADTLVPFRISIDEIDSGRVRSLTLATSVVPGASRRFRFGGNGPVHATFQAACFPRQPDDYLFQGEAVAQYLADQLRQRGIAVGDVSQVYFGACHYFGAELNGQQVGVGANWEPLLNAWMLRIDPPLQGTGDEVEALCQMLRPILDSVDGLTNLEWHSDDPWEKVRPKPDINT
jgi:hypothetical protein